MQGSQEPYIFSAGDALEKLSSERSLASVMLSGGEGTDSDPRLIRLWQVAQERMEPVSLDCIELYYHGRVGEAAIGQAMGMSQAGASYRIHRALSQLRWLAQWPGLDLDIEWVLAVIHRCHKPVGRPEHVALYDDILRTWWAVPHLRRTGERLSVADGIVRHTIHKTMVSLRQCSDPEAQLVLSCFEPPRGLMAAQNLFRRGSETKLNPRPDYPFGRKLYKEREGSHTGNHRKTLRRSRTG